MKKGRQGPTFPVLPVLAEPASFISYFTVNGRNSVPYLLCAPAWPLGLTFLAVQIIQAAPDVVVRVAAIVVQIQRTDSRVVRAVEVAATTRQALC